MRVCVIGTSNAIYSDGYAAGIRDHRRVTYFEKHTIGASPSVIVPYFSSKVDFSRFDWVVIETTINDQNYLKYGSIRRDQIRESIEFGIAQAAACGCRTALMVMPTVPGLRGETIPRLIYRKISTETGALLFDGFEEVDGLNSMMFIDRFHINKRSANLLGRKLASRLSSMRSMPLPYVLPKSYFYTRPLQSIGRLKVSRSNSMLNADFVAMSYGDAAWVEAGPWDELAAVAYNAARSTAIVALGKEPSINKSLWNKYSYLGKDLLMLIAPVTSRPRGGKLADGRFSISVAPPGSSVNEGSRFDHLHVVPESQPYGVEISAAIFRRRLRYAEKR